MSKAFLRESDLGDDPVVTRPSALPEGARNYLTAFGAESLREELARLVAQDRAALKGSSDPDDRRELQRIDHRTRQIEESLRTAEIVDPAGRSDTVRFGSSVTLREANHEAERYRIVGVDEIDFYADGLSWLSPLAQALLNQPKGGLVSVQTPGGVRHLEILQVE